ncbi:hypothetical protein RYX36_026142 [Vicia faba]
MSSRVNQGKRSRNTAGSLSRLTQDAEHVEFDNTRFIRPLQQAPPIELNFDLICEFYANALPIGGVRYYFCTFVQGRAISFTRDEINQYLENPLTLHRGELCAY